MAPWESRLRPALFSLVLGAAACSTAPKSGLGAGIAPLNAGTDTLESFKLNAIKPIPYIPTLRFVSEYSRFDTPRPDAWGAGKALGALWRYDLPYESEVRGLAVDSQGRTLCLGRPKRGPDSVLHVLDGSGRSSDRISLPGDTREIRSGVLAGTEVLISMNSGALEIRDLAAETGYRVPVDVADYALADLDGNGNTGLAVIGGFEEKSVRVYDSDGSEIWAGSPIKSPAGLAAGRLFGMDSESLVAFGGGYRGTEAKILSRTGAALGSIELPSWPRVKAIADLGGGVAKFVMVRGGSGGKHDTLDVWNIGRDTMTLEARGDLGWAEAELMTFADLDGDGRKEILLGTKTGWLLVFSSRAELIAQYKFVQEVTHLAAGDFTSDGIDDAVVAIAGIPPQVFGLSVGLIPENETPEGAASEPLVARLTSGHYAVSKAAGEEALAMDETARREIAAELSAVIAGGKGETRWLAAFALQKLGPSASAAADILIAASREGDHSLCTASLRALTAAAPDHKGTIPALSEALADPQCRYTAVTELRNLGPKAKGAVPALIERIRENDISCLCAGVLKVVGKAAKPAIAELVGIVERVPSCRDAGAALRRIGPDALDALLPLLAHRRTEVRVEAVRILDSYGPEAEAALPAFESLLREQGQDSFEIYIEVAAALGSIGEKAVPILVRALDTKDADRRSRAAYAVSRIGRPAVSKLIETLESGTPDAREGAAQACINLGPDAVGAVPALIAALSHEDPELRTRAADALSVVGPAGKKAVAALERAAEDNIPEVREAAKRALLATRRVHPDPAAARKNAAKALADDSSQRDASRAFKDENWYARQTAAAGLTGAGPGGVKALTYLLEDGNWQVRHEAARRLAWSEAPAVAAIPKLIRLLDDPSLDVRARAALTLGKLGRDAMKGEGREGAGIQATLKALGQAAKDADPDVSSAALRALASIQRKP
ncbi:MAG: hypothetical protein AUJ52_00560 [Elusimicrobia bacterium CG1_02_63_36]|nr:MAG: hypothetical protein AUJ52_00560 [Elusimicrobia bacterium CG1_02_63_36]PIP82470.1 MAG: hypothetical protein COR54_14745 [Elusimicrobia bacterium CG22_combo_CG10-13_8_21_14_all_63_91]PJA16362.1 MAG: hypothetical protein COX66_07805 [Elusimicrobia bacterium CG_4_10_14_0_2_um_filter_63_34]PJB26899.1 MAG: hypothetical protein CO113_01260 [Elusimicrobia bacterium CG_4_9_14_3_um_filter_62_55]